MNFKMIGRFLSQIIAIEAFFMLPALGISFFNGETTAARGFVYTIAICVVLASVMYLICRKANKLFAAREGLVCVGFSWIMLSLLGALPFVFSGAIPRYIDAVFEIVSGFTTTGASVIADVEALSKGILYWRSFSHWLGGMGVLVFLLAIVPSGERETGFTMHLLRAESPGPDVGKLVPKMKNTAMILYIIYVVMTIVNFIFLLFGNMSVLDALCTAFGTAGTGGFGVFNDSMGSCSPYVLWVTTVFMLLFGINFSCYYLLLLRQFKNVLKDEELRLYFGIFIASALLIAVNIFTKTSTLYDTVGEVVTHAAFQVSSIMTTTGFSSVDFNQWSAFSKSILLILMLIGACAGSTGGGFKVARLMLMFKNLRRNILHILNHKKVQIVRNNGKAVSETVLANTNAYLAAYVIIIVISCLVLSLDGNTMGTTLSAVLACFNNIGPGFEAVGPLCNYAHLSDLSKIVLSLDMLAGRLEIFPILALLSRNTWKSN